MNVSFETNNVITIHLILSGPTLFSLRCRCQGYEVLTHLILQRIRLKTQMSIFFRSVYSGLIMRMMICYVNIKDFETQK